ncbi:MAG: hypothetical protein IKM63_04650 [Firmicutes bacterium]|nr:hypothetical protein [Bacillota bacterium]
MKKKVLTTLSVVLILGLAALGILAYLQSEDSDVNVMTLGNVEIEQIEQERIDTTGEATAENLREFTGNEDGEEGKPLYPLTPGYEQEGKDLWNGTSNAVDKLVSVKNTGKSEAYVRTWFAFEMGTMNLDEWKTKVKLNINETDWIWADGSEKEIEGKKYFVTYAVYEDALGAGETTSYSLKQVALINDATNEDMEKLDADKDGNYEIWAYTQAVQVAGFEIASGSTYCASADLIDLPAAVALDTAFGTEHPWKFGFVYDGTTYETLAEAVAAAGEKGGTIEIATSEAISETINIHGNITLKGVRNCAITRADGFAGTMFTVKSGATLTIEDVTLDGAGATATGNLISTESNAAIILNEGAVLKNNNGAHAVNLGTRIGATLEINGGEIINNSSDSGAIWGGGHITMNSGKISNNSSTGIGGAIRMVSSCNFTMNGGEMNNNKAAGDGGAIWGYGSSTYNFNGGEMSNNESAGTGGAMYTGDSSVVNISGTFELCNNIADDAGALRLSNRTAFNMSGGKVSGNVSKNNAEWNGFYGWNPGVNISGGELADDICIQGGLIPTIGVYTGNGVIHFDLSTNHNTANLAKGFGTIKFTVAAGSYFSDFNFKPALDYTYTAGDEAKLKCMNEGYSTYWDATKGVFKIKAD